MAMINCSECGANISDKAKTCIHCGCPIEDTRTDGNVVIKLPRYDTVFISNAFITDEYGKELWRAKMGQVATIYLPKQMKIIVNCGSKALSEPMEVEIDPKGNPRFEMIIEPGFHWKAHYILNRVDMIDSD